MAFLAAVAAIPAVALLWSPHSYGQHSAARLLANLARASPAMPDVLVEAGAARGLLQQLDLRRGGRGGVGEAGRRAGAAQPVLPVQARLSKTKGGRSAFATPRAAPARRAWLSQHGARPSCACCAWRPRRPAPRRPLQAALPLQPVLGGRSAGGALRLRGRAG